MASPASVAADALGLPDEVFLLSLREDGKFGVGYVSYALGGAILAELVLRERVVITGSGRKQRVEVRDGAATGVPLYDECLGRLRDSRKLRSPSYWVERFAVAGKARDRVSEVLGARGVLRIERTRVLLVFPRVRYRQADAAPRRDVLLRLGRLVLGGRSDAEPRTLALLALANSIGLLRFEFGRKAMKPYRAHVKQLVKDDPVGKAVRAAVAAAQAQASAAASATTTSA